MMKGLAQSSGHLLCWLIAFVFRHTRVLKAVEEPYDTRDFFEPCAANHWQMLQVRVNLGSKRRLYP
jgi:hypothetical protein